MGTVLEGKTMDKLTDAAVKRMTDVVMKDVKRFSRTVGKQAIKYDNTLDSGDEKAINREATVLLAYFVIAVLAMNETADELVAVVELSDEIRKEMTEVGS